MSKKSYGAEDIEVLEGLEPVRKRPGMYVAGTDTPAGLHQLAFEILDNSVDEAMNGYASEITLTLHKDSESVTVSDNGRGIPVDEHPKFKKSALELILTTLHAGGKFSDKNYKTAGGLHGVGSSVVNALSKELIAIVRRDGKEYSQRFARGFPKSGVTVTKESVRGSGTTIFFRPDPDIFRVVKFSAKILRDALQMKAYLNPGLRLFFKDETHGTAEEFCYEDGLRACLNETLIAHKLEAMGEQTFFIDRKDEIEINIALAWTESTKEIFLSYVNGIHTIDGGSHEIGAKAGIVKAVRNYISVHDVQLKGIKLGAEDIREGLVCLVSVKLPGDKFQAQFQGQTKSKLNNPEIAPIVETAARGLEQLLNEKPTIGQMIVERVLMAAKARAASRAAGQSVRRKIGVSHRLNLPGKLADCSSTKPEESELFIVEGDSAGGSTKQGRDRHIQAVLPLRGKVLNSITASDKKVLENKELSNIVSALGIGSGEDTRIERLRYGKVIILTDADADGMHIATLLLAFFFTQMPALIAGGNLYLGKSPLYGIFPKGAARRQVAKEKSDVKIKKHAKRNGKAETSTQVFWAYSDQELEQIIKREKLSGPRVVRYKGLGEMNPETLWETTLDPETRTLLRVTVEDESLVSDAFQALMGSDPSLRTKMIQDSAETYELDI